MRYEKILYEPSDQRATVTINRPDVYNAFDYQTLRELADAFRTAADDDRVGVVVLTGAGDKAFCTGADLKEQEQFLTRPHNYFKWFGGVSRRARSIALGRETDYCSLERPGRRWGQRVQPGM